VPAYELLGEQCMNTARHNFLLLTHLSMDPAPKDPMQLDRIVPEGMISAQLEGGLRQCLRHFQAGLHQDDD
jgi:hypothetical protein